MKLVVDPSTRALAGTVTIPGDKSIGHRALLFSLLSETPVRVRGLGDGADNGRSAKAITALGATIVRDGDALVITGTGPGGMSAPADRIDCGNSGTTIRLLCGLLAGQRFQTTLFGDDSLSKRPMRRVIEPLVQMGATITGQGEGTDVTPPLVVGAAAGRLTAIDYALPMASAQVKTAVLLAGLYADGATRVTEPGPSRDHSERMLAYLGAPLTVSGRTTTIDTRGWDRRLAGAAFDVPSDPSSSAFLVVAALVAGADEVRLPNICVNPTRTGFLDAIAAMGGRVALEDQRSDGPEPTATLVVTGTRAEALVGTMIAGDLAVRSIDELPILAVLAARARGTTVVRDAEELRVKESDRIATTIAMLRAFGVDCEAHPDGFSIEGRPERPLTPAHVHADGDHRIAMAAAVAGLVASGQTVIDDADNVATSYPGFAAALAQLGAKIMVHA
ncbi:MAG TPA: 3-phosphoshikimate 1-carboxyvinyltransferase [Kofleriaceae bacterium]|nr:3-phosphoshikimate 1-carboxyvinyltransferase [Kofleriaceae bacterium]